MTISRDLAAHIVGFPASALPATALHATRRALLDGIGVTLGASGMSEEAAPFIALAESESGSAALIGRGRTSSTAAAALANGALSHALDFEDAFDAAPCHPNAALLPALLAAAQTRGGVSGGEFLTAMAVGCDLVCRLGLSLTTPMEAGGWYPPPILGGFGAVAAVARIMGLTAEQVCDAWSMMLCRTGTPGEIKYDPDTVLRAVREAFPAQTAITVCQLAARGVRGFAAPLEGKAGFYALYAGGGFDEVALRDGLGERFWIEQLSFKRWPSCRGTHPHIEAARKILARRAVRAEQVVEIVVTGGNVMRMLAEPLAQKRAPATAIDAKFSLPFTVAATFIHGDVTLDSFTPEARADRAVLALAAKVRFEENPDWGRDRAATGRVSVVFADGSRDEEFVDVALGAPSAPLSDDALVAKFVDCAGRAAVPLDLAQREQGARAILKLSPSDDALVVLAPLL